MSPSFFFSVPEKTPRTVWRCQPDADGDGRYAEHGGDVVTLPHHAASGAGHGVPPRDVYSVQSVRSFSEIEKA